MFAPRRGKASINPGGSPQFQALYIGNVDAYHALGQGCTRPLVQRMLDNCRGERYLPRVLLTLSPSGLILKDLEKSQASAAKFDIQNISYCSAENGEHDRVFAWICKANTGKKLDPLPNLSVSQKALKIASGSAILPSHHYSFYAKKLAANDHTTNCKKPFTFGGADVTLPSHYHPFCIDNPVLIPVDIKCKTPLREL